MTKARLVYGAAVYAVLIILATVTQAEANTLSVTFSRNYTVPAFKCQPYPDAVTIWQVESDLALRGATASEFIVPSMTAQSKNTCDTLGLRMSWDDMATLAADGWDAYPRGVLADDSTDPMGNTCGLLPTFTSEGYPGADELYAPADNKTTPTLLADAFSCYTHIRHYSTKPNTDPVGQTVNVISLNGTTTTRYSQPANVIRQIQANPHAILQGYRFVTGEKLTGKGDTWDCTSAVHWTSRDEVYCYSDLLAIIDGSGAQLVPLATILTTP